MWIWPSYRHVRRNLTSYRIQNGRGSSGQVGFHVPLKVKREPGVRQQVGILVMAARSPRDVHMSIDLAEADLGAPELSGIPPPRGERDGAVACQGVLYPFIHSGGRGSLKQSSYIQGIGPQRSRGA